jgi:hypothetical protein
METVRAELDWVSERIKCEVKIVFENLRQAVEKDVEQYKSQPNPQHHVEFENDGTWSFSAVRSLHFLKKAVVFHPAKDHIEITFSPDPKPMLKAFPVLTKEGHCKFSIEGEDGEEMFEWQFRRRFLEPILFDDQLV